MTDRDEEEPTDFEPVEEARDRLIEAIAALGDDDLDVLVHGYQELALDLDADGEKTPAAVLALYSAMEDVLIAEGGRRSEQEKLRRLLRHLGLD